MPDTLAFSGSTDYLQHWHKFCLLFSDFCDAQRHIIYLSAAAEKTTERHNTMFRKNTEIRLRMLTVLLVAAILLFGIADTVTADSSSRFVNYGETVQASAHGNGAPSIYSSVHNETAMLCGVIPLKRVSVTEYSDIRLCPGGMTFGVKLFTEGVVVVGFSDIDDAVGSKSPAYDAGLRANDRIIKANGEKILCSEDFAKQVATGKPISVTFIRQNFETTVTLTPSRSQSDGAYKTGMWLKDSTSGIGTVTFIDPESGAFAGLGHGICDSGTGEILPLGKGYVAHVTISGVVKGQVGAPGELKGYFDSGKTGALLKNCDSGVYGVFSDSGKKTSDIEPIGIALKGDICEGNACILASFEDGVPKQYSVRISHIDRNGEGSKNFIVTITDPALLEKTGGIIQGMSGSPIIQNGKLIGAVTHVLINDPTTGYGIFIENMLSGMPEDLK